MSKIGRKPIAIPADVEVQIKDGSMEIPMAPYIHGESKDGQLVFSATAGHKQARANWGTMASLAQGAIIGAQKGFAKKLQLEGVGYRVNLEGKNLVLGLGFSHPIKYEPPAGIKITVEKNIITVAGVSKALVGEVAAKIRKFRKPDPYHGTGIRSPGEVVRKKAGKKAAAAEAGAVK